MEQIITNTVTLFALFLAVVSVFFYYKHKTTDSKIENFYKSVDYIRDSIHKCKSSAEYRELNDEIKYLEDTFSGMISDVVLKKEVKLLKTLINKKNKKAK